MRVGVLAVQSDHQRNPGLLRGDNLAATPTVSRRYLDDRPGAKPATVSLPGGGAEIFAERVRRKICDDKATGAQWLDVHRTAHKMGLRSNCTMLYGTIETLEERVDHMLQLRALQAETGGFQTFTTNDGLLDNSPLTLASDA